MTRKFESGLVVDRSVACGLEGRSEKWDREGLIYSLRLFRSANFGLEVNIKH